MQVILESLGQFGPLWTSLGHFGTKTWLNMALKIPLQLVWDTLVYHFQILDFFFSLVITPIPISHNYTYHHLTYFLYTNSSTFHILTIYILQIARSVPYVYYLLLYLLHSFSLHPVKIRIFRPYYKYAQIQILQILQIFCDQPGIDNLHIFQIPPKLLHVCNTLRTSHPPAILQIFEISKVWSEFVFFIISQCYRQKHRMSYVII